MVDKRVVSFYSIVLYKFTTSPPIRIHKLQVEARNTSNFETRETSGSNLAESVVL